MINTKAVCTIFIILFVISMAANAGFSFMLVKNFTYYSELLKERQFNERVLAFRDMFTRNILLSTGTVSFDTRLAMETAVRNLEDKEIFSHWQAFTESQTKEEASAKAKALLELLIDRTAAK